MKYIGKALIFQMTDEKIEVECLSRSAQMRVLFAILNYNLWVTTCTENFDKGSPNTQMEEIVGALSALPTFPYFNLDMPRS